MINNPKSTWTPMIERFLVSWARADEDRGPIAPLVLGQNYHRASLQADFDKLKALIETESRLIVEVNEKRAVRDQLKAEVLELYSAYNHQYRSMSEKPMRRLEMHTPSIGMGAFTFSSTAQSLANWWVDQDQQRAANGEPTIIIRDGITATDFKSRCETLDGIVKETVTLAASLRRTKAEARLLVVHTIYPRLVAYRHMIASLYAGDHPLRIALPKLDELNIPRHRPVLVGP